MHYTKAATTNTALRTRTLMFTRMFMRHADIIGHFDRLVRAQRTRAPSCLVGRDMWYPEFSRKQGIARRTVSSLMCVVERK